MAKSTIEWTNTTWNPTTGCSHISPGCANCYAERMAKRLQAMGQPKYQDGFRVAWHEACLEEPLTRKRPRVIFVNSISDLFHEKIPVEFIQRVFATMEQCPQHIFQILTKRSQRLRELSKDLQWPEHIWMGVSVESNGLRLLNTV